MDTIKDLYYGNINPCVRDVEPDSRITVAGIRKRSSGNQGCKSFVF